MRQMISIIMALFATSCTLNHTDALEPHEIIAAPEKMTDKITDLIEDIPNTNQF